MNKSKKVMGAGLAVLAALTPASASFATMTASNVENFYNMPLTITRIDYHDNSVTLALRGEVTKLNMVTLKSTDYEEWYGDQHYEEMGQVEPEWGETIFRGEVSELPRQQEVVLQAEEGFSFYDDFYGFIYYALEFADGTQYEGKIRYAPCTHPLKWGGWDMDTMERVEYSDEEYECRVHYYAGKAALSAEWGGEYMSEYTREIYTGGDMVVTTYEYDIEAKTTPITGLPADIKSLEDVAEDERLAAEAAEAEAAREAEKAALEAEKVALEEEKAVLEAEKAALEAEITRFQAEVADLAAQRETELAEAAAELAEKEEMWATKLEELNKELAEKEAAWESERAALEEKLRLAEEKQSALRTVYVTKEVTVEKECETCVEQTGMGYEYVETENDDTDGAQECITELPALNATENENDDKPWWILIPVTAIATFLACWWLLPEVKHKD